MVIALRRLVGKKVLIWGHGVNYQPNKLSIVLHKLRAGILKLANGYLVYTDICVAPFVRLGFGRTRIEVTKNVIDASVASDLTAEHPGVVSFRLKHGLGGDPCVVF